MLNHPLTRRDFLKASTLGGMGLHAFGRPLAAGEPSIMRKPCPPSAWQKHGIVLDATEPWEQGTIKNFTCKAEPLDGDRWRLWYYSRHQDFAIGYAEGTPGGSFKKVCAECSPGEPPDAPLAIGNLPEKWKPVQAIHLRLNNGRHRLYFWAHGPAIVRYLAADSEDGRQYRVLDPHRAVLYHPGDRAAWGVPDPHGFTMHKQPHKDRPADEPLALSRQVTNDATNVYQLPDGTFEMYSVGLCRVPKEDPAYVAFDNVPGCLRVIDRYTSEDGLHFENRRRIITRDAADPVDQQFYYLAVTYTPQGRVGVMGHYRVQAQTMDMEWCFSTDGVKWDRPARHPWLPRGDKTQVDSYGVYCGNGLVQRNGKWHLFYTGVNSAHNGRDAYGPKRSAILYATTDSIGA